MGILIVPHRDEVSKVYDEIIAIPASRTAKFKAGQKLIEAAPSLLQDTLSNTLMNLPEIEQVSITLALEKLVDLMEARHIGAAPHWSQAQSPPKSSIPSVFSIP